MVSLIAAVKAFNDRSHSDGSGECQRTRFGGLCLPDMYATFLERMAPPQFQNIPFDDRLIDREIAERRSRALRRCLKKARLHHADACFEDISERDRDDVSYDYDAFC